MVQRCADALAGSGVTIAILPAGTANLLASNLGIPKDLRQAIQDYRADVPEGIIEVLNRMLAKDPEDRYQEPIEVAEALAEWADLPIDPPPAKEMPGQCPLVLALTGHCADKVGSSSTTIPLGRAIFGPGRGALRAGGSSGRLKSNSGVAAATAETARVNGSKNRPGSSSSTVPLQGRGSRTSAPVPRPAPSPAPMLHRHLKWILLGGMVLAVLFAGGAAVFAYYMGKMNSGTPMSTQP